MADTGDLWAVVQERDGLGDNLPSDYLIRVQDGGFYGWPYACIGPHPQPGFAQLAPDKVKAAITPDQTGVSANGRSEPLTRRYPDDRRTGRNAPNETFVATRVNC